MVCQLHKKTSSRRDRSLPRSDLQSIRGDDKSDAEQPNANDPNKFDKQPDELDAETEARTVCGMRQNTVES